MTKTAATRRGSRQGWDPAIGLQHRQPHDNFHETTLGRFHDAVAAAAANAVGQLDGLL